MSHHDWTRRLFGAALIATAAVGTFAPAQAQENTIANIKARGKLLAGVKFDTPPFGYLGDKNEPIGFDLDLVRKVAEHIGVPVELVSVTSTTRVPMLVSGNVDLTAASMTHTRERDKTIDFSITYYTGGQSLLVAKSSTITGLKDLDGKQVSVQQGTTLEKNIAAAAPKAKIVAFKDYNSAWLALAQGRVDALTGSLNILQGFANGNPRFQDRRRFVQRGAFRNRRPGRRLRAARRDQFYVARFVGVWRIHSALPQMVPGRPDGADRDVAEITTLRRCS